MKNKLHPLKFTPIFKEKVWGGQKLRTFLKKEVMGKNMGESWEISDVDGDLSVINNGELKGKTLRKLIEIYKNDLLGNYVYEKFEGKFPLLIKFIDAKENLSVQLHPNDKLARERHDSSGKTEMWYVLQADENSGIIAGFKDGISKEDYEAHLKNKTLNNILNFTETRPGDTFFIKPGLIHAIGGGVFLAEIQQTSDITYRVYDWDRKSTTGEERKLHTYLAKEAIDFDNNNNFKIEYTDTENEPKLLVENKYFTTRKLKLHKKEITLDYSEKDCFVVFIAIEGNATLKTEAFTETLKMGETLLIPANFNLVEISSDNSTLLEVTI